MAITVRFRCPNRSIKFKPGRYGGTNTTSICSRYPQEACTALVVESAVAHTDEYLLAEVGQQQCHQESQERDAAFCCRPTCKPVGRSYSPRPIHPTFFSFLPGAGTSGCWPTGPTSALAWGDGEFPFRPGKSRRTRRRPGAALFFKVFNCF